MSGRRSRFAEARLRPSRCGVIDDPGRCAAFGVRNLRLRVSVDVSVDPFGADPTDHPIAPEQRCGDGDPGDEVRPGPATIVRSEPSYNRDEVPAVLASPISTSH